MKQNQIVEHKVRVESYEQVFSDSELIKELKRLLLQGKDMVKV